MPCPPAADPTCLYNLMRPKLVVRPIRTILASASTSKLTGRKQMHDLVDCCHRAVAILCRSAGDRQRGLDQCGQSLRADDASVAANPVGECHANNYTRPPVVGRARGAADGFHTHDQQTKIPNPRGHQISDNAAGRLHSEYGFRSFDAPNSFC
jgi:hypothetical protein